MIACALFLDHPRHTMNDIMDGYIVKHKETERYLWICEKHYEQIKHAVEPVYSIDGIRLDKIAHYFIYSPCEKKFVTATTLPDGTVDLDYWDIDIIVGENNQPAVRVSFAFDEKQRAAFDIYDFEQLEVLGDNDECIYIARYGYFE